MEHLELVPAPHELDEEFCSSTWSVPRGTYTQIVSVLKTYVSRLAAGSGRVAAPPSRADYITMITWAASTDLTRRRLDNVFN